MPSKKDFTDDEAEAALALFKRWLDKRKVSSSGSDRIRKLIARTKLKCVPIAGAAAMFHISIHAARGYVLLGILEPADTFQNHHIFSVLDLKQRYATLRREQRTGKTLGAIAPIIKAEHGADD